MDITSYLLGKQSGGGSPTPVGDKNAKVITIATSQKYTARDLIEELPTIDFSSAYNCQGAFASYVSLKKAGIKNTKANMNDATNAFYGCTSLTDVDLSEFSFGNISSMTSIFEGCSSIEEIDFSQSGSSSKLNYAQKMFKGCTALKRLLLPTLNLTQGTNNVNEMFKNCTSLELLDISGWDVANNTPAYYTTMFDGVPTTCTIYVKDADAQTWFSTNFPNYTFTVK